jgi:anti-sigma regulatory factor (Ser/Thr protein kinase)
MDALAAAAHRRPDAFRHEALLYAGPDGFLDGTLPFIEDGLAAEEPILVMVGPDKIELLHAALNSDARGVQFADMAEVGRNPARIIPAWSEYTEPHLASGRAVRGIGEPIWAGRSPAELVEYQRHESLLNLAFAGAPAFRLLCPYDTAALRPAVIAEAHGSHPVVRECGASRDSNAYRSADEAAAPFDQPLPEPPAQHDTLAFEAGMLDVVREFVCSHATEAGLSAARTADLVLAVNELTTNSLLHGGGEGDLLFWSDGDEAIWEVRDRGGIDEPLAGRERPGIDRVGGHGLWLVNQLCDLVQVRSYADGGAVRVHMRRD